MSPAEYVRHEKRRYEDDPTGTIIKWIKGIVEIIAGTVIALSVPRVVAVMVEHKPLMQQCAANTTAINVLTDSIRVNSWRGQVNDKRLTRIERKMRIDE